MGPDRTARMLALYGVYAGISLIAWWVAYGIQALPAAFSPLDVRGGHIAAEVALGAALVVGGVLTGLTYATLNVMGDYLVRLPARTPMFMLLMVASASAVATLVMALRRET
jgi:hypothetical protein